MKYFFSSKNFLSPRIYFNFVVRFEKCFFESNLKRKKMTEKQRILFSEILILNLEFNLEKDPIKKWNLVKELRRKKISLRRSMGVEAYERLLVKGRKAYGIKNQKGKA